MGSEVLPCGVQYYGKQLRRVKVPLVCRYQFKLETAEPQPAANVTWDRVPMPFQEIEWCWGYIGYVQMLQYHVEKPEEVVKNRQWRSWKDARNADILLDEDKLTALLRLALEGAGSGRAHHGKGTLSAYG